MSLNKLVTNEPLLSVILRAQLICHVHFVNKQKLSLPVLFFRFTAENLSKLGKTKTRVGKFKISTSMTNLLQKLTMYVTNAINI